MILGTASGAYTSVDQGDNWSKITTIGGVAVNAVAFDTADQNYVYLATNGGVFRSSDGGKSFLPIYYSTFPAEVDVRYVVIDPFDVETGYIGTMRGAYVTHNLRTAKFGDWAPLGGVQSILAVPRLDVCSRHRGHLYALTRAELNTINYGADSPESAILESWDGGRTWRQLFTGQSSGIAETFAVDSKDPDQLWIGWSKALHRLARGAVPNRDSNAERRVHREVVGPPVGEVMRASLKYHGLELDDYAKKIRRSPTWSFLPRVLRINGTVRYWSAGGEHDDAQFAAARYLQVADGKEWEVMAWASWSLPDFVYSRDSVPMLRQRVAILNDELRGRLVETVLRSYGELQRIQALLPQAPQDVATQVIYRLRIEQLEAVVDLTSGGYLTRWQTKHRRDSQ